LDDSFLRNSLDADERSRIEIEDGHLLIITNVPTVEDEGNFDTLPLGIVFTPTSFITVCSKENRIIKSFNKETSKYFNTADKTQFMLNILFRASKFYLRYLDYIYKKSERIEEDLRKTMKNKALFQLFEVQKSLVYFTTALKDNYMVLQKILRLSRSKSTENIMKFTEDDIDLLEDVIIENKQALEMVEMHRNILENMMDAFASIISNNLNIVMKRLTAITIILAIPTMFASFWGMNVELPSITLMPGFIFVIILSLVVTLVAGSMFAKKGMF
jgi:magnesium transporter